MTVGKVSIMMQSMGMGVLVCPNCEEILEKWKCCSIIKMKGLDAEDVSEGDEELSGEFIEEAMKKGYGVGVVDLKSPGMLVDEEVVIAVGLKEKMEGSRLIVVNDDEWTKIAFFRLMGVDCRRGGVEMVEVLLGLTEFLKEERGKGKPRAAGACEELCERGMNGVRV
jgi:hypothetical protein